VTWVVPCRTLFGVDGSGKLLFRAAAGMQTIPELFLADCHNKGPFEMLQKRNP